MTGNSWKPTYKQELAIGVPDTILETFFGGAAGPGKTETGIVMPLVRKCKYSDKMWYQHPKFKGIILRRTVPEVKKELMKRAGEFYPQTGAKPNYTDRVFKWPWGAEIWLAGAEHEDDILKYDTEQFCYIFFEELTSFTEFMYIYMLSRCRPSDPDLPSCMFSASNPGNIGHGWVRKRFVEPNPRGGSIIRQYFFDRSGEYVKDEKGNRKYIQRIFIPALATDNPHLLENDPDYLVKLEALPEAQKAAKLYGDWWTFSGQVFDTFRPKKYPDEPDNAIHVIPNFAIPEWWPRIIAIDWGYNHATVAYWAAISPSGRIYIYREYYVRQTDVAVWGTEIGELSRDENIKAMVLDTNAWDSRGEEKSVAAQFQEKFTEAFGDRTLQAEQASKGRISGKILVQEMLRWKQKPVATPEDHTYDSEQAEALKRISDIAYKKYMQLFAAPKIEENIPRLQIIEGTSPKLVECIPLCVYDDKDNVEDVKEFEVTDSQVGDDPYDCLRYLVKRADRYVKEAASEFNIRAREEVVVARFQETKNITGYYRQMEKLEHTSHKRGTVARVSMAARFIKRASLRSLYRA